MVNFFDARKITTEQWVQFLTDKKHLLKTKKGEMSHTALLIKDVTTDSDISIDQQQKIAKRAVQALLDNWKQIPTRDDLMRHPINDPLVCVCLLVNKEVVVGEKVLCESIVPVLQKLAHKAYEGYPSEVHEIRRMLNVLGAHVPWTQAFLEHLFVGHEMLAALKTMLLLGRQSEASSLFKQYAPRYRELDPQNLYFLEKSGMPKEALMFWLDQSVNTEEHLKGNYNAAAKRWKPK